MNKRSIERPIVIVADLREEQAGLDERTSDLDVYTREEIEEITAGIRSVCSDVTTYPDPPSFIDNIGKHKDALVLPFWSGTVSRNRTALIAAISEAYDVDYFGADTYAYIVGQDKFISKQIAREFDLKTPAAILVRNKDQLDLVEIVELPLVIKPNLQGSSMGISQKSLCHTYKEAQDQIGILLRAYDQPVIVEHFIEGMEVTVTIWGPEDRIRLFQAVEIYEPTGRINFAKTIWSIELKKEVDRLPKAQRPVEISTMDKDRLMSLFKSMGKLELVRIDGRLNGEGFHFLEMNPEPYLGRIGSVAKAFEIHGSDYVEMFRLLLSPFDIEP